MPKKTLREVAEVMGMSADRFLPNAPGWKEGDRVFLALDNRYAIVEDEKGLHLTDLTSWARFSPVTIGKKASVTPQGVRALMATHKQWKAQRGEA